MEPKVPNRSHREWLRRSQRAEASECRRAVCQIGRPCRWGDDWLNGPIGQAGSRLVDSNQVAADQRLKGIALVSASTLGVDSWLRSSQCQIQSPIAKARKAGWASSIYWARASRPSMGWGSSASGPSGDCVHMLATEARMPLGHGSGVRASGSWAMS